MSVRSQSVIILRWDNYNVHQPLVEVYIGDEGAPSWVIVVLTLSSDAELGGRSMGRFRRILCISVPYACSTASLICLAFVGIGCTSTSKPQNELFFMKVFSSNLENCRSLLTLVHLRLT
jgi:hypothetical protein